jgi:arylsulfatase
MRTGSSASAVLLTYGPAEDTAFPETRAFVTQTYPTEPVGKLSSPRIINLIADPQEREPLNLPYLHSWTATHFNRLLADYQASVQREPPVPAGAPLDHVPASEHDR